MNNKFLLIGLVMLMVILSACTTGQASRANREADSAFSQELDAKGPGVTKTPLLPDLIISAVSISPAIAQVGQPVTFTVTISNIGRANTPDEFVVGLQRSGADYSGMQQIVPALFKGKSTTIEFVTSYNVPGDHTITAYADLTSVVTEISEGNNAYIVSSGTTEKNSASIRSANGKPIMVVQ